MPQPLPHITILLCTANGARFLAEQLQSYLNQSHANWSLWISDDGSTDDTRAILDGFRAAHGDTHDIRIVEGPGQGAAANFMSLLCHPDLPPGAVALSDQDDVWHPGKLERALEQIADLSTDRPVLYGAQSIHVDDALTPIGASHPPPRPPAFANALTQNIVSGHSAVLNSAALALVRRAGPPKGIEYHDWWLYQLFSGAREQILIDHEPVLFYRQHDSNVLGVHRGWRARAGRVAMVLGRTYGRWIAANIAALKATGDVVTPENHALLDMLQPRLGKGPLTAWWCARAGLYRQTRLGSALFYLAVIIGSI